ncbi:MAG: hypothetical protein ACYDCQ_10525 [Dehalococcoidia bacterium]
MREAAGMRLSRQALLLTTCAAGLLGGAATVSATHSGTSLTAPTLHGTPSRAIVQPRPPAPPPRDLTPETTSRRRGQEPPRAVIKAREQSQGGQTEQFQH